MRRIRTWPLVIAAALLTLASTAQTGANTVGPTRAGEDNRTAGPNDLKPADCASITVTNKLNGSGIFSGTSASDLITGSSVGDLISAGNGDDCVLGGDGNDTINGGSGTDVCIGGPGNDTFLSCEVEIQ